jgi:hypothetical protein
MLSLKAAGPLLLLLLGAVGGTLGTTPDDVPISVSAGKSSGVHFRSQGVNRHVASYSHTDAQLTSL